MSRHETSCLAIGGWLLAGSLIGCSDSPTPDSTAIQDASEVNSPEVSGRGLSVKKPSSQSTPLSAYRSFSDAGKASRWREMVETMTPAARREFLFICLLALPDRAHAESIATKYKLEEDEIDLFGGSESLWPHLKDPGKVLVELLAGLDEQEARRIMDHFPDAGQVSIKVLRDDRAIATPDSSPANEGDALESVEMKKMDGAWYVDASTPEATVEIGGKQYKMEYKNGGFVLDTRDEEAEKRHPMTVPDMTIGERPVEGTILGRAFQPDKATYNGAYLELRSGEDFFADAEAKVFLFLQDESPAGKSFLVSGGDDFGNPHVHLSAKLEGDSQVRSSDVLTDGYYMRLEFQQKENDEIPGRVFLQAPGERESKFAGTFRAKMDADDNPAGPADDKGER